MRVYKINKNSVCWCILGGIFCACMQCKICVMPSKNAFSVRTFQIYVSKKTYLS